MSVTTATANPDPTPLAAPGRAVAGDSLSTTAPTSASSLFARACHVLHGNRRGRSTVPAASLYPHQWSWDSAFVAIGLRHLSPLRAQRELETLLAAQWGDGRIPHIVFNPSVPPEAYFPGPGFWRSSSAGGGAGAPASVETSGIVQPPVHALAVWLVHRADPGLSRARGFLRRAYPRLAAWHRYLLHRRDLGSGLASVIHPWEQGMDNSPCWDRPLVRVTPAPASSFHRADLGHAETGDRPTDLDYGRYVRLAADYRDRGYTDGAGSGFAVEDPAFNALLIASEHALAGIATELGIPSTTRYEHAERLTRTLVDRLWDENAGMFLSRDATSGELIPEYGVNGLIPLLLPALPRHVEAALADTLHGPRFGLSSPATTGMIPSYDLTGHAFDPHRYWRGPAWFNTGWLIEHGLRTHGRNAAAARLHTALIAGADTSGFAEYVDPYTGEARGTRDFSWTAALTLDLLRRPATAVPHQERARNR